MAVANFAEMIKISAIKIIKEVDSIETGFTVFRVEDMGMIESQNRENLRAALEIILSTRLNQLGVAGTFRPSTGSVGLQKTMRDPKRELRVRAMRAPGGGIALLRWFTPTGKGPQWRGVPSRSETPMGGQQGCETVLANPAWKRILDLASLAAALPLLAPLFAVLSVWVKLSSRGPVFFCQTRVGAGGREFRFYKFRSMRTNAETASHETHLEDLVKSNRTMTKLDALGDPRLIPGGNLLRASGLDELPQVWNVLRGDMSLVGPRPCTPKEFALYRDDQKKRFRVLPGLTGYWQVKGKNKTTFTEMIALDSYYVDHRSLLLDLTILLRTPMVLVSQILAARRGKQNCTRKAIPETVSNSKT